MTDSRQGPGTLKLDTFEFSTQAAAVKLIPKANSSDGTPTLATPDPAPDTTIAWELEIDAVQDFTDAAGLVNYLMDNALAEVAFEWVPITSDGTKYAGNVQIVPMEVGGDVAVQVVTKVTLPLVGEPTRTDGALRSSSPKGAEK